MRRTFGLLLGAGLILSMGSVAHAQGWGGYYPPAGGEMYYYPPVFTSPWAVGGQYVETFPTFVGNTYTPMTYTTQPVAPAQPRAGRDVPAANAGARARRAQQPRTYVRGYNQLAVPQGQLYWPGSYVAPGYTPFSRYQTYGSGYSQSPYGSNFYSGYWKGWPMAFPMIGD